MEVLLQDFKDSWSRVDGLTWQRLCVASKAAYESIDMVAHSDSKKIPKISTPKTSILSIGCDTSIVMDFCGLVGLSFKS